LAPATARDQKLEQATKQDGRFVFPVSEKGKYTLGIVKPGYPPQYYRQAGFANVVSAIVVCDGQDTSHLVFEADRGSAITGLIKDEDSEPVGHALVAVLQSVTVDGSRTIFLRNQVHANAVGEFRFANLLRGDYYICAMGRPWFADSLIQIQRTQGSIARAKAAARIRPGRAESTPPDEPAPPFSPDPGSHGTAFVSTFYPNAPSVEHASPIRLGTGKEVDVSIVLPLTTAVSVKGVIRAPEEMGEGRAILSKKVGEFHIPFLEGRVGKDGTFQFQNVPPGAYQIVAGSDAGSGASSWSIEEELEVRASDIEVTLRPRQMGSLSGRLLFEGERPAPTDDLFVTLHNEKGAVAGTEASSDGRFSLRYLPAGRYEVTAGNWDYIAAYFAGPEGQRLPLAIEISSGETVRHDLMLTRAVSVIEGTVEKSGVSQTGAFVLLMPKDSSKRWAYRVDQTDSDGSYRLAAIPSGDYSLIALSDGDNVAYREARVAARLSNSAKPVHVEPGEHLDFKLDVVGTASLNLPSP
jgi:hypothetical protein